MMGEYLIVWKIKTGSSSTYPSWINLSTHDIFFHIAPIAIQYLSNNTLG